MYKFQIRKTLILFLFVFCSCTNTVIPYINIKGISFDSDSVCITLSEEPNQNKFMNAFSFSQDNEKVLGTYNFDKKTVTFYPHCKIEKHHDYFVEISTELEATNGHSLQYPYFYEYSLKNEKEPPYVVNTIPADETINYDEDLSLVINFSEPIDIYSFKDSFSISPTINYICIWNNDNSSVELKFEKQLEKNTTYKFSINTTLKDLNNNKIKDDYNSSFVYYPADGNVFDYSLLYYSPEEKPLSSDTLNIVDNDVTFKLNFTNKINVDAVSSYISFFPSLKVSYEPDWKNSDSVVIKLAETPDWGKKYTMIVKAGLTDIYSQKLIDQHEYSIQFSKEKDRPVEFVGAILQKREDSIQPNDFFLINSDNVYTDLNIPVEGSSSTNPNQSESEVKKLDYYCFFRISDEAERLLIPSVLQNIRIQNTNSCINVIINNCSFINLTDIISSPFYDLIINDENSNWNFIIVKFDLRVQVYNPLGEIKFLINKGIEDNIGNQLLDDLVFTYNKT
jgi:hypothetical protein